MIAIFKRELRAYFFSPIAYVLLGLFTALCSFVFIVSIANPESARTYNVDSTLSFSNFILICIVPIFTMKMLAEDRKNGNDILLFSSPVRIIDIVMGKFLAIATVFLVMTAITFIYPLVLVIFGKPNYPLMFAAYFVYILVGLCLISIGMFASSLTENQIVAAIISFISLFMIRIIEYVSTLLPEAVYKVVGWFALFTKYDEVSKGVLTLSPIVYYLSFISLFVFLTVRVLEKRRWSQG